MAKNVLEVISYFESLYKNKAAYLWGANGETITKDLCDRLYKTYGSQTYNRSYYDRKLNEGIGRIGADCSGAMYPMSGYDTTAKNYYSKCIKKGNVSSIPRDKACLVFKGASTSAINHIGFYCGNGYVIEMKSSKDNCVKDKLDGKGWRWYGVPSWIDYSSTSVSQEKATKCVDVSSYQGNINWALVKADGINHSILKVIRKDLNPDKRFEQNWRNCKHANIDVIGVYNYSYAVSVEKAKSDANKVLSILNGRKTTIWLDVEDKCQQGLGKTLIEIINAYGDVITSAGYDFGIYSGMSFIKSFIKPYMSQLKYKKLWVARYYNGYNKMDASVSPNEQYNPKNNLGLDIYAWQYTSSGQVSGINGNVDLNIVYGNVVSLNTPNTPTSPSGTEIISETSITALGKISTNSGNLYIRSAPSTSSSKLGYYKRHELVSLISKTSNGWYRTDKGYISDKYVSIAVGKVNNCSKLNLRNDSNVKSGKIVKTLNANDNLYLLKLTNNNWYKVRTEDNIVGYVSGKYITVL